MQINPEGSRLDQKGKIAPGADADLVLWEDDENGVPQAIQTWVGGRTVHRHNQDDATNRR